MENICGSVIDVNEENNAENLVFETLKESSSISMKKMTENALKGLNMATKKSVIEAQNAYENTYSKDDKEDIYCTEYTEVLNILEYYLIDEDYNKIPKEMIEFFEKNADRNYRYKIDKTKTYIEQSISRKTNSIIVSLYKEYFASKEEKRVLEQILSLNESNLKRIEGYEKNLKDTNRMPNDKALIRCDKECLWMKIINKIRRKLVNGI